jgi:hypothetical protein
MNLDIGVGGLSASGAAGGGNVFNAAPLFGNYSGTGGSSEGNDAASASSDAAAKSPGSAVGTDAVASAATSGLDQDLPYILLAGGAFLVVVIVKKFLL